VNCCEENFRALRQIYPRRMRAQRWSIARRLIDARIRRGANWQNILTGAQRYANWCRGRGIECTEYVQQAATFFGSGGGFDEQAAFAPQLCVYEPDSVGR
jgi:hypothetical protein